MLLFNSLFFPKRFSVRIVSVGDKNDSMCILYRIQLCQLNSFPLIAIAPIYVLYIFYRALDSEQQQK